jgi:hypothetical protein
MQLLWLWLSPTAPYQLAGGFARRLSIADCGGVRLRTLSCVLAHLFFSKGYCALLFTFAAALQKSPAQ